MKIPKSLLRKVASRSDHSYFHHASIIISGGRIISWGYNRGLKHAEEMALRRAGKNAKGATLVNVRLSKSGRFAMSRPCLHCGIMIGGYGIKKVMFSNGQGKFEEI